MVKISFDLLCQMDRMKGEMNGTVTLRVGETKNDPWFLDFKGPCGTMHFENVIKVIEPHSKNPGILVERPFGLRGLKEAIALIEAERAKHGLTTLD